MTKYISLVFIFSLIFLSANEMIFLKKIGEYQPNREIWIENHNFKVSPNKKLIFFVDQYKNDTINIIDFNDPSRLKIYAIKLKYDKQLKCISSQGNKNHIGMIEYISNRNILLVCVGNILKIYKVDEASRIDLLSEKIFNTPIESILLLDSNRLFISQVATDITLYDISNLNRINSLRSYPIRGTLLSLSSNKHFLSYKNMMKKMCLGILDISNINNPKIIGKNTNFCARRGKFPDSVYVKHLLFSKNGKYAYGAGGRGGLMVFKIKNDSLSLIKQTSGKHWGMLFNCTPSIRSIAMDEKNNILYMGTDDPALPQNSMKCVRCIKGVKQACFVRAENIAIEQDAHYLIVLEEKRLAIYQLP